LAEYHATTISALTRTGLESILDVHTSHEEIVTKYPSFAASRSRFTAGYLNRGDGWCDSTRAVEYARVLCGEKGAEFVVGTAGMVTGFWGEGEVGGQRRVKGVVTADGEKHAADLVIMATGAWSGKIVPGLERLLKASGQAVVHLKIPKELIGKYGWEAMPTWNVDITSQGHYGFAANQDGIFKLAHHGAGYLNPTDVGLKNPISLPRTIVDHPNDTIPRDAVVRFRAFLADVFPQLATLDIIKTRMCWYTDTFDGNFLMDHHPDFNGLFVATGGSGHGMKFLPVLGEEVVNIIEGKPTPYAEMWRWRVPVDNGKKESARMVGSARILQESEMADTEDLKGGRVF
ncbi:FAD dependent oxidoreductase-domain-containing protein, partial [Endogone sp. FLAS-F59071]